MVIIGLKTFRGHFAEYYISFINYRAGNTSHMSFYLSSTNDKRSMNKNFPNHTNTIEFTIPDVRWHINLGHFSYI